MLVITDLVDLNFRPVEASLSDFLQFGPFWIRFGCNHSALEKSIPDTHSKKVESQPARTTSGGRLPCPHIGNLHVRPPWRSPYAHVVVAVVAVVVV